MDRLEAMSVFVAAVETGSLAATGKRLGMSPPTVSRKLSELETHLKARLLVRSTRRLSLTEAGAAFLPSCRGILEELAAAERVASGEYLAVRGELTVSAPVMFGRRYVLPVVNGYLAAYPDVRARLTLSDRNVHLLAEHVDAAVRIGPLADSGLVAIRVGSVRRVVCASPDYLARVGEPRSPADLHRFACVTFDCLDTPSVWTFAKGGSTDTTEISVRPRFSVNSAEAAVEAAVAGLGLTEVASYHVASAVEQGALTVVLRDFEAAPLPVSLVHAGEGPLPLKTRAFLDLATARLRRELA